MVINRGHAIWCIASLAFTAIATGLYLSSANHAVHGATGNSISGILFGIAATLAMILAGLLAARKRIHGGQLGTVKWWLRGHLWIGMVSVPLVFFHSGFRFGGPLEQILMWCFLAVILSGIVGQVIQQFAPRFMRTSIPQQAIFEQLPIAIDALKDAADQEMLTVYDTLFTNHDGTETEDADEFLRTFYLRHIRVFLQVDIPGDSPLIHPTQSVGVFATVREGITNRMLPVVNQLELICNERRQLITQNKLQWIMHGWTLVHIPLSVSLLILALIHIIMSLYY
ncbi:MAG: hypothetical protein VX738_02480 [Planctomycetota bacterium]|nr:hypothetical protein [Planctomycetota bacterium]